MANTKKTEAEDKIEVLEAEDKIEVLEAEDKIEVFIPRGDRNSDPNKYVSVNGNNYLLPKGKTSLVPKCVADEIERANYAQRMLDESIDALKFNNA